MGSTNKTTNYELSQYIGTDKPSWLNDYNNDMLKIDTQMKANATAAGNAQTTANSADGKADSNTLAIGTLNTQINTPDTGLAATVAGHTTAITGINNTIGSTPLTTTAQTLTGAIEEVKGSIPSVTSALQYLGFHEFAVIADGVKTYSAIFDEIWTALITYISSKAGSYRFTFNNLNVPGLVKLLSEDRTFYTNSFVDNGDFSKFSIRSASGPVDIFYSVTSTSGSVFYWEVGGNYENLSVTVATSGVRISLAINEYSIM